MTCLKEHKFQILFQSQSIHFCPSTLHKVDKVELVWAELTLNPRTGNHRLAKNVCLDDKDSVSRLVDEVIKLG